MSLGNTPLVSIVVPCRNERRFIAECLDSIIANDYPKERLEVIVADGLSDDGTRGILDTYSQRYPFIKYVDNPKFITSAACNVGILNSTGDVIVIMGAHTIYGDDYVSKCVKALYEYNADNVGGLLITLPKNDTLVGRAIAHTMSSRFGFGNATFRTGSTTVREVDTVFGGCYRREIFDRVGLYDDSLPKGEDREFNLRLRAAGGKIMLVPDIKCYYYARSGLVEYCRYMILAGKTPFSVSKLIGRRVYLMRNVIPPLYVLSLLTLLCLSPFSVRFWRLFLFIISLHSSAGLYFALPVVKKERQARFLIVMPLMFAITHIFYGIGSIIGVVRPADRQMEWAKM